MFKLFDSKLVVVLNAMNDKTREVREAQKLDSALREWRTKLSNRGVFNRKPGRYQSCLNRHTYEVCQVVL